MERSGIITSLNDEVIRLVTKGCLDHPGTTDQHLFRQELYQAGSKILEGWEAAIERVPYEKRIRKINLSSALTAGKIAATVQYEFNLHTPTGNLALSAVDCSPNQSPNIRISWKSSEGDLTDAQSFCQELERLVSQQRRLPKTIDNPGAIPSKKP